MKIGSLFTGYGGLDTAIGGELAWYAEIDKAACEVLAHHYPGVPNLGDITMIDWTQVEPVDVLTGGYPCQPFSHAGLRKGKNDDRHLWPYVRDAIHTLRPEYAVLENVSGHLTLGFADVLSDLATIGFDAEWGTFRASDAGACHQRARLFIVAHPARGTWGEGQGRDYQESERSTRLATYTGSPTTDTDSDGHGKQLHSRRMGSVEGQATGSPQQRERARCESDPRGVHDVADTEGEGLQRRGAAAEDKQRKLAGRRTTSKGNCDAAATNWGKYAPAIRRWETVLGRPAPTPTVQRKDKRRLNPVFVEWMMGLDEGHVTGHGLSSAQELKMLGNGVVPQQARAAIAQLMGRIPA
jgi:DNA (cytosine-5)-methyltransferase 1